MITSNNTEKLLSDCIKTFKHFLDITVYWNISDRKWNIDVLCIGKAYYGEGITLTSAIKDFRKKNIKCV